MLFVQLSCVGSAKISQRERDFLVEYRLNTDQPILSKDLQNSAFSSLW